MSSIIKEGAEFNRDASDEIIRSVRTHGDAGFVVQMQDGAEFLVTIAPIADYAGRR